MHHVRVCWYLDRIQGRPWHKSKPIPEPRKVYGIPTTAPNAVVEPIHPKGDAGDPE
jgi:hypothetical protein